MIGAKEKGMSTKSWDNPLGWQVFPHLQRCGKKISAVGGFSAAVQSLGGIVTKVATRRMQIAPSEFETSSISWDDLLCVILD